jgi:mono/diheme cytochrome c family protein
MHKRRLVGRRVRIVLLFSVIVAAFIAGCATQPAPSTTSAPTVAPTATAMPAMSPALPQTSVVKSDKNPLRNLTAAATAGKPLFEANCVPCHGETGKGDGPIAASLTPKPANLTEGDVVTDPDGELFLAVRMGKKDKEGKVTMTPLSKLTDEQIWQIVAYVRTLAKK